MMVPRVMVPSILPIGFIVCLAVEHCTDVNCAGACTPATCSWAKNSHPAKPQTSKTKSKRTLFLFSAELHAKGHSKMIYIQIHMYIYIYVIT